MADVAVGNDPRVVSYVSRDDWDAGGHRFQRHVGCAFEERGQHGQIARPIQPLDVGAVAHEQAPVAYAELVYETHDAGLVLIGTMHAAVELISHQQKPRFGNCRAGLGSRPRRTEGGSSVP